VDVDPSLVSNDGDWDVKAHPLNPTFAAKANDPDAVVLRRDGHEVSFSLQGAKAGDLESPFWFWDDWSELAYRNVATGTDLQYDLTDAAVKESLILDKLPGDKHTWTWNLDPGDLTPRLTDEDALELVDASGTVVMWSPTPVAWDASQTDPNKPRDEQTLDASLVRTADGGWVYKVNVDADWLQSKDRVFPVTIDPEMTVTPVNQNSYKTNGAQYIGQLHVGNTNEVAGGYFWRAIENFAGGAAVGQFIEGSNLTINYLNGSTAAGAGVVRVATGWCYTCLGTQLGGYTLSTGSVVVGPNAFRQYIADQFGFGGTTNVAFMISGGESSAYTYKQISSSLWIKYHAQITPSQVTTGTGASPTNGATGVSLTPSFKSTSTAAATGSSLAYSFRIGLDANFSQMVYTSPETTTPTATVPPGILKPGTKYYWRAYVHDLGWDGVWGQSTLFSTGAWSFTTNQVPYPSANATASPGSATIDDPPVVTSHTPQLSVAGLPLTDSDSATAMRYKFTIASADGADPTPLAISGYVTPDSSGTARWMVPSGSLQDGGTYTWTLSAFDGKDVYLPTSNAVQRSFEVESTRPGGSFVPLTGELANSTTGVGTSQGVLTANAPRILQVAGSAGVPTSDVSAVSVTIAAISPASAGVLSAGPGSGTQSDALRYRAATTTTSTAVVPLDENGQIKIQTSSDANITVHLQGYFTSAPVGAVANSYVSVPATRVVNTHTGTGLPQSPISGGQSIAVQIGGAAGVPVGARGAFLNFQIDNNMAGTAGYINPYAATTLGALRFPGSAAPASIGAFVPLDSSGLAHVYVSTGSSIDLAIDVEGYVSDATTSLGAVLSLNAARLYDSSGGTHVAAGATVNIPLAEVADVPSMKLGLTAVLIGLTVVDTGGGGGSARAWAHGTTEPSSAISLAFNGGTSTNLAIVPVGTDGSIDIHNVSADAVDYVVDMQGWYAIPPRPAVSCPNTYTANGWAHAIPTAAVTCTVQVADTGDSDGSLTISVDGEGNQYQLPAMGTLQQSVQVPAAWGWHQVQATANYSDGTTGSASFSFGLESGTPSALLQALQSAAPEAFMNLTTGTTSSTGPIAVESSTADSSVTTTQVATDPSNGITVATDAQTQTDPDTGQTTTTPAASVEVQVPTATTASNAVVEAPGVVSFDNGNGSETVSVVKQDASVQNFTVINNASAPSSYTYPVSGPPGSVLSLDSTTGMVSIVAPDGSVAGGFAPPWAKDANGVAVPTHYVINSSSVTQVVDLSAPSIAYPVIADPWLGAAIFKVTVWAPHGYPGHGSGPVIVAVTSAWGRMIQTGLAQGGGYGAWLIGQRILKDAGWNELKAKVPAATTRATYRQQYECHVLGAYTPFSGGPSWDFEGLRSSRPHWRTDGGASTFHCNWK